MTPLFWFYTFCGLKLRVLSVASYVYKTWSFKLTEKHKMSIFGEHTWARNKHNKELYGITLRQILLS